jgi:NAD(P)-dependent dehydrogenase (short-subunit alcohol dehydrogenase family)
MTMDGIIPRNVRRPALALAAAGAMVAVAARFIGRASLERRTVLVTGGSRGLGFLIARECARGGARVVICARDLAELERARAALAREGHRITAIACDVSGRAAVTSMIDQVTRTLGGIDVLVNNAGVIEVGPFETMTLDDFARAMDVMFWGMLHTTTAVLPQMRARGGGRIVNVTSIGGRIAVPHLAPYSAAKFAAVGLSEGLRAELAGSGVRVLTVTPGLMRTGSHVAGALQGTATGGIRMVRARGDPAAGLDRCGACGAEGRGRDAAGDDDARAGRACEGGGARARHRTGRDGVAARAGESAPPGRARSRWACDAGRARGSRRAWARVQGSDAARAYRDGPLPAPPGAARRLSRLPRAGNGG